MTASEVIEISRESLMILLKVGGPIMAVALITGLLISFIQALTQIQEMTIAFVPKIIATFAALFFGLPLIGNVFGRFATEIFNRIATIGH
ncbi:flagellar biosynthetic protein FliQ [Candidatus Nucleicultrix amoebiphila]|jgi:flagellar biosynthetic protein FliQ|uniref:Flagellar biosynthesis protein FliQ n=1 Tax=Candidatus Nucleicultrix amoebiphila FS5 TaxID=1414854 RepID=A0A1W6N303_9PROT|nr:flagellar biosynthetic protein FliQ [Candidatus Nucleicultrix amoebiphila]ARN84277.1 flagellar biosynthesis protein FliQ [Candidatus Nucleicultrix amoebiphila FS5]